MSRCSGVLSAFTTSLNGVCLWVASSTTHSRWQAGVQHCRQGLVEGGSEVVGAQWPLGYPEVSEMLLPVKLQQQGWVQGRLLGRLLG